MNVAKKAEKDVLLSIVVKTLQQSNKISYEEEQILVYVQDPPIKGRANKTILKMLKKQFKKEIKLESGFISSHKVIRIKDIDLAEVITLLQNKENKKKKGKMRN